MTKPGGNEDRRTPVLELQRKGKAEYVFKPSENLLCQRARLVNCTIKQLGMDISYFKDSMKERLKMRKPCCIF